MTRLQYVVGLCFDLARQNVAMVHKLTGPPCVVGKWNGVGGKIEKSESALAAMVREFDEETGVRIPAHMWARFAILEAKDYDLFFYWTATQQVFDCKTVEKERIEIWDVDELLIQTNLVPNLRWMLPYLQDFDMIPHDLGTLRFHHSH